MIFQYPVVALFASLATDITEAASIYCQYVSKPYFAKLWVGLNVRCKQQNQADFF
jgi:hypothetical protein